MSKQVVHIRKGEGSDYEGLYCGGSENGNSVSYREADRHNFIGFCKTCLRAIEAERKRNQ